MTEYENYVTALWSVLTDSSESAPVWFSRSIKWHASRLPSSVSDDFVSLVAVELLDKKSGFAEAHGRKILVNRAIDRVRKRLLTELGLSARAPHRRGVHLSKEPESSEPSSSQRIETSELRAKLKKYLSPSEMLVMDWLLEGKSDAFMADQLGVSTRTVQRIKSKMSEVLLQIL